MKEEQRYAQQLQIEKDRNTCLKGIWDELKTISALLKEKVDEPNEQTNKEEKV